MYSWFMLIVHDSRWVKTGSPGSRVQFESERGDRYLLLDGKRAYHVGFGCQTCSFLFERLAGANGPAQIEATAEALRNGVSSLDDEVVRVVGRGLPEGEYAVILGQASVEDVTPGAANDYFVREQIALWGEDTFWCLPHDPRVPYFRAGDKDIGDGRKLFNFVVPMFPLKWLTMSPESEQLEAIKTKSSGTAVSIAILDVRGPADWHGHKPDPVEHWCLTHYLLDGHHKLHAASRSGKPLRLLSFVACSQYASEKADIERVISVMVEGG
jgi:hypothetical protein